MEKSRKMAEILPLTHWSGYFPLTSADHPLTSADLSADLLTPKGVIRGRLEAARQPQGVCPNQAKIVGGNRTARTDVPVRHEPLVAHD